MRDDVARINLTSLDAIEKRLHVVVHVGLAHFHGDALAKGSTKRDFIEKATVDTWDGYGAALSNRLNRLAQHTWAVRLKHERRFHPIVEALQLPGMRFQANRIDASIRPDPSSHILECSQNAYVLIGEIDAYGTD